MSPSDQGTVPRDGCIQVENRASGRTAICPQSLRQSSPSGPSRNGLKDYEPQAGG